MDLTLMKSNGKLTLITTRPTLLFALITALIFSSTAISNNAYFTTQAKASQDTSSQDTSSQDTSSQDISGSAIEPKQPRKIWSGWMPYYSMRTSLPAALNNQDLIREVMLFWFTLKGPNRILDLYKGGNPSIPMDTPLSQMRAAGYLLIPTITDGMGKLELQGVLAKPKQRTQTIETIMALIRSKNFDGIDLDLEGFAFVDGTASWEKTRPLWVEFIKELSAALKAENKLLSVTTPVSFDPASGKRGYWVYDWPAIAPYIDRLRIMTYDYATSRPGPIGPLFWAEDSVKYAVSVLPASKVYLGVAGYGRDWVTKVVGTCPKDVADIVKAGAKASTFVMRDAPTLVARYGANAEYKNREGEVNFTYERTYTGVSAKGSPTTCTASRTAWYQDPRGYLARANLVSKYRLGGLVAWTIGMEEQAAMVAMRAFSQDIAPDIVRADLKVDRNEVNYGGVITLNANFRLPDKAPVTNLATRVEMKSLGGSWRTIYQGETDQSGNISLKTIVGSSVAFRILSEGSWERLASSSSEIAITTRPQLLLSGSPLITGGLEESLTARVVPTKSGVVVRLDKFDHKSGSYVEVARTKTGESGEAQFLIKSSLTGFSNYRARITRQPKAGVEASISNPLWITIVDP